MEGLKDDVKDILIKNNCNLNNIDLLSNLKKNERYRKKNKLNSIIFNSLKKENNFLIKGTVSNYTVSLILKNECSYVIEKKEKKRKNFFFFNFYYTDFIIMIFNYLYIYFLFFNIDFLIIVSRLKKSFRLIVNDFLNDVIILYFINIYTLYDNKKKFIFRYSLLLLFLYITKELLVLNQIDFEITDLVYKSLIYFNFFIILIVSFINKKFNLQEFITISSISYLLAFLYKKYSLDFLLDDNKYLFFDIYHVIFLFILTVCIKYVHEILKIISLFIFLSFPLYLIYKILILNNFDLLLWFKLIFYADFIETFVFDKEVYIVIKPFVITLFSVGIYILYILMRTICIVFNEYLLDINNFINRNIKANEIIKWLGFNEIVYMDHSHPPSYINKNYSSLIFKKISNFFIFLNLSFLLILFMFFNGLLKNIYYTNYFEKNNSYCDNLSNNSIIYKYHGRVKIDLFFTDIDEDGNEKLKKYIRKYNIDIDDEKNRFIDFYCEIKYI